MTAPERPSAAFPPETSTRHSMPEHPLSPRDLVRQTLAGFPPPRLPLGELVVEDDLVRELVDLPPDAPLPLPAKRALLKRWGHDLITVAFSGGWGAPVQPDPEERLARVRFWAQESDLFVFALVDGPFSLAARAWSWDQALIRFTQDDSELESFLADAVIEMSEWFETLADAGAQGVILGDDIAYRRGPYVRPGHLRTRYFPFLTLMTATAQDLGLAVVFHSDGNLWPVWEDIVAAGVDGIHGLDPYASMSLALARQRSPDALCLWGNLDLGWLMNRPDREQVRAHLTMLLEPVRGTPIIFGSNSGLYPGLPLNLLDALYAEAAALSVT